MELKRYADQVPFAYGDIELRELTPDAFAVASFAEVVLPIGVDRPSRENAKEHRMYICFRGDIEFVVDDEVFHLTMGDVVHIAKGETYGFHNGGYETARLLLIRVPGPAKPDAAQP